MQLTKLSTSQTLAVMLSIKKKIDLVQTIETTAPKLGVCW